MKTVVENPKLVVRLESATKLVVRLEGLALSSRLEYYYCRALLGNMIMAVCILPIPSIGPSFQCQVLHGQSQIQVKHHVELKWINRRSVGDDKDCKKSFDHCSTC